MNFIQKCDLTPRWKWWCFSFRKYFQTEKGRKTKLRGILGCVVTEFCKTFYSGSIHVAFQRFQSSWFSYSAVNFIYVFIKTRTAVSKFSLTCEDKDCTFCLPKKVDLLVGLHQLSDVFLPHGSCEGMKFQYFFFVEDQQCLKLPSSVQSNKAQTQVIRALHCKGWVPPNSISSGSLTIFLWSPRYLKHSIWKHLLRLTAFYKSTGKIFFFGGVESVYVYLWSGR